MASPARTVTIYAGGRNPLVCSSTNRLCGTEHLSQSPVLGLRGWEEELRRSAMLEWIFLKHALMNSRWGRMIWIGSKNPHPFNRQFIYLARGANVKMPWRLAFIRRMEDSPYWAWKPRSATFMGSRTLLSRYSEFGEEPALQCRRQSARRTHRH